MNWMLIVVLVILAACAIHGRAVGLVKTVFATFSTIIVVLATVWISPQVSKWMQGNEKVYEYFSEKVDNIVDFSELGDKVSEQVDFINELPLPNELKKVIQDNNNSETYAQLAVDNFEGYVVNYLTCIIINALAFIGTFLVLRIALGILAGALDLISKLPVLNGVNKLAGFAVGLVHGLIIVWIGFVLITMFGGSTVGQEALKLIGESKVLEFLYDNNLILKFITNTGMIAL
ncbi:MAG: CvpA family protein [Lachnospiraceae bacterium]|nr:CvpA family protein [Lachnospiraceae bacterium]